MATNIINELDSQLASLNQLKPPGASKGKIQSITQLCVTNIQAENSIAQSLYRALKKAPATHKLGAIYVVDSVVRRWIEQAKKEGENLEIEGRGEPGTYPAAVRRLTELMPALFDDVMKALPAEQKEKLEGMVRIWEKGSTFPAKMLADFKSKLSGATNQAVVVTNGSVAAPGSNTQPMGEKFSAPVPSRPVHTPLGYPPQHLYDQGLILKKFEQPQTNGSSAPHAQPPQQAPLAPQQPTPQQQAAAPAPSDVNSILAALASAAPKATPQQHVSQPVAAQQSAPPQMQLPPSLAALFGQQNGAPGMPPAPTQSTQPQPPTYTLPQTQPAFQVPPNFAAYPPQQPPSIPQPYAQAPPPQQAPPQPMQADPLAQLRDILPANILNDQEKLVPALRLLQDLQKDGIPMDQWGPVLQAFEEQYQPTSRPTYGGYDDYSRGRGRSRSPERGGGARRGSPVYETYDEAAARQRAEEDRMGRAGNGSARGRYRQRSPMRNSPAPIPGSNIAMNGNPMQPKFIQYDNALPPDCIKVLSRTLFVGGANGTQQEIQNLFERFGRVQTCIANRDKRHAFVKMTTRGHALNAKGGMERLQAANDREVMNVARQTKWGVGFGPRECCDYQKGESIIPIHKLTEADMKWLLTAEYGGTGGQRVEGGMVLEEPDIEIGAGVSSKAMSKRVLPDTSTAAHTGGNSGGKRQRDESGGGGGQQRRDRNKRHHNDGGYGGGYGGAAMPQPPMQMEAYGYARPEPVAVATPPAVPGFGFALPGAGGQQTYR